MRIKRVGALLMAATIVLSSLTMPQKQLEVYAAGAELGAPSQNVFLSSDEMEEESFNSTYNLHGGEIRKVYYGSSVNYDGDSNKQRWYIAGYQDGGLVLFCDPKQPINVGGNSFNSATSYGRMEYKNEYGTYYNESEFLGNTLNNNHYGASSIRKRLLKLVDGTSNAVFTNEEVEVLQPFRVAIFDTANKCYYYVEDKISLPSGLCLDADSMTFLLGSVKVSDYGHENDSQKIGVSLTNKEFYPTSYYNNDVYTMWTHTPFYSENVSYADNKNRFNVAKINTASRLNDAWIDYYPVDSDFPTVVPVINLDLSTVLFASDINPVNANAAIDTKEVMTVRYDGRNKINSDAIFIHEGKDIYIEKKTENADVYLYVAYNLNGVDRVYSKKINETGIIESETLTGARSDLSNVRVWIETKDKIENKVYAKYAIDCPHADTEVRDYIDSTCTKEGWSGDTWCVLCDEKLKSGSVIEKKSHTGGMATCINKKICSVCKNAYGDVDTEVHIHTEVKDKKTETCVVNGYTGDVWCTDCKNLIEKGATIKAEGHSWDNGKITKKATCTDDGVMTYTCQKCKVTRTEAIESFGHTVVSAERIPATCYSVGKTAGTYCSVCNAILTGMVEIPMVAHKWGQPDVIQEPSCREAGIRVYTCIECGETKECAIPKKAHTYVNEIEKARPGKDGSEKTVCSECGNVKNESVIPQPVVSIDCEEFAYNGSNQRPNVVVETEDGNVIFDDAYTIKYENESKKIGTYTVTVVFSGNLYTGSVKKTYCIVEDVPEVQVNYRTQVQNYGWMAEVSNGAMSGTSGESKRLETIKIKVTGNEKLGVQYTTHCQTYGWLPWSANGEINGTEGESKRLEAIKIQLTGSDAEKYDLYYRVHAQSYGWLGWAKNGEMAGTAGLSRRLEGIQIVVTKKDAGYPGNVEGIKSIRTEAQVTGNGALANPTVKGENDSNVAVRTHVQSFGWQGWKYNGQMSGTSGMSKRLEGINIKLTNQQYEGGIEYRTHVQRYGWMSWKTNGEMSGTSGESKRLEAIQIRLTGEMANHYDIYYRVHAQRFGWLGWAKNGEMAGTAGYSYRLESIQVVLVPKNSGAPANKYQGITGNPSMKAYEQK